MFSFLTRRKRMSGGLYFGPPAWHPTHIEEIPATAPASQLPDYQIPKLPDSPASLIDLLEHLQLKKTSTITPSLLDQLHSLGDRNISALILNLLPTQPEFALSSALVRIALPEIAAALRLLQNIIQPRRTLIVVDRHDFHTRHLLRRFRKTSNKQKTPTAKITFDIKPLLNQYPQSHPTLLIGRLFGKRLPVGRLPVRVNRIIVDPVTCWAFGRHLLTGQPFTHRPVQLFNQGGKDSAPRLVMAKIGETVDTLCRHFAVIAQPELGGGASLQTILNGMLAGEEIDPARTRVDSATESIAIREIPAPEIPTPCFACGWCVDVCPTGLNPVSLLKLAEEAQHAFEVAGDGAGGAESPVISSQLRSSHARESLHCIGCGLCSYVCPTRLPLTQQTLRLRSYIDTKQNP